MNAGWAAAACAFFMIANQMAGKATRDALFLSSFDVTALPRIVLVAAVITVLAVLGASRVLARVGPGRVVPVAFLASGGVQFALAGLAAGQPRLAAVLLYLHISVFGAVLISWFWSLVTERFDPRTARQRIGRIAGGGTLGGLVGGIGAERAAAALELPMILRILALLHVVCAVAALALSRGRSAPHAAAPGEKGPSGFSVLAKIPYLRNLALLVAGGTVAASLLDYVFKVHAQATFTDGAELLRFFALFYTAVAALTFVLQSTLTQRVLERFGLARSASGLPLMVGVGAVAGMVFPGLPVLGAVRGSESAVRSSIFRSAYELFYAPVPPDEKRASKTIIDVGAERLGDGAGAGLIQLLLWAGLAAPPALLGVAAALGFGSLLITSRLHRGYVKALERNLLQQGAPDDTAALQQTAFQDHASIDLMISVGDPEGLPALTMTATRMQPLPAPAPATAGPEPSGPDTETRLVPASPARLEASDPLQAAIAVLRSSDTSAIRRTLHAWSVPPPQAIPFLIPLLARDALAGETQRALRKTGDRHVGQLVDVLLDEDEEFTIRRRIPRVLAVSSSPRASRGLCDGLKDRRFEVRYQCGVALSRIARKSDESPVERRRILDAVEREARVDERVWAGHRLLDEDRGPARSPFFDEVLRERSSRSLEHVFTLLSLVFPAEPLRIAYRGLHTQDQHLRGTALEYLESVLPDTIREALWPFLDDRRAGTDRAPTDRALDSLLQSHESIMMNLEDLKRRRGK